MHKRFTLSLLLAFCTLIAALPLAVTHSASSTVPIHLRRATFDPLVSVPTLQSAVRAVSDTTLRIVQLDTPPDSSTKSSLEAAGMHPLAYIPDNAFLVRMDGDATPQLAALRWSGTFELAFKLPAELDTLLTSSGAATETLRLLVAPDANAATVGAAVTAAGGSVLGGASSLNGTYLRIQLPTAALRSLLLRDDVLWVERYHAPKLSNDEGRKITGVTTAREQLSWLTGTGQIVAVTDTGLDQESSLSADFSGRIAASYGPSDMYSGCSTSDWSDHQGHGTHVSGTVLGSGALSPSGSSFAGFAPDASLVVENISSNGSELDCLADDTTFLSKAYDAGARVQNASWGGQTGGTSFDPSYGGYDSFAAQVDSYLWNHKEHLLVVAAGNEGDDANWDGVIDSDTINSPATAKNVLTVGATENSHEPSQSSCAISLSAGPTNLCYNAYGYSSSPFSSDFISDNADGMAAFSSRGPTDDGRIKPEIVAPGTNVISARSHTSDASYDFTYNSDYAYDSGTSMATPMVSGVAALVRQWLATERSISAPSAALVKALLLNGATNITPGQYGTGSDREIPSAWPNNVEGWGRMNIAGSVELTDSQIWLTDNSDGLNTDGSASYTFSVTSQDPFNVTLAWTDYPASTLASKALVNDLDLELEAPDGSISYGNADADLSSSCRENSADRCNNVESVSIDTPQIGTYTLHVKGYSVAQGPQPFALVARLQANLAAPTVAPTLSSPTIADPAVTLSWTAVDSATSYQLEVGTDSSFDPLQASTVITDTSTTLVLDVGSYMFRVMACNSAGCGPYSNVVSGAITVTPEKQFLPLVSTSDS